MEDVITRSDEVLTALLSEASKVTARLERISGKMTPTIAGERYLTGEEMRINFRICPRTLQNYRDTGQIPWTRIGNRILYPKTEILKLLRHNFNETREWP